MEDNIKVTGHISFKLFDEKGNLKEERSIKNLVTSAGKTALATWLAAASQSTTFMPYIGVGTGTTAAATSDVALVTELATRSAGAVTSSSNVWQSVASFGVGVDTGAITEAGLFSASSSGTLFARQVFSAINKGSLDTLQITWQVTFS
jgi:hypothetical protein